MATSAAGEITFEPIDVRSLRDEQITELNDYQNEMRAESRPEDPPVPFDEAAAFLRNLPTFVEVAAWVGRDSDGKVVCGAQAVGFETGDNVHVLNVDIGVLPSHRRCGIARTLLRYLADEAARRERRLLVANTTERVPAGAVFAERVGARPGLDVHVNRLVLEGVDRDLVRRWIDDGPSRAPGYELIGFDGRCPDDLADAVVAILDVMNDAPRDDLELEDRKLTVEQLREQERLLEAQKAEHWWLFARHLETGELVGLTEVVWNPSRPETVNQGDTGVRPEHRGKALGKWLKATMLERICTERPGAKDVRTGNADSNDAMLAINRQLGFRPHIASRVWQADLATVEAYLAVISEPR